ncbi:hypothetical protein [Streptomyces sp. NPDC088736]|uniref:hypothetical protein n=1 Tax=Streptomyces sp. NPDC088736 TaxID=3365881 RepID=UPI003804B3C7
MSAPAVTRTVAEEITVLRARVAELRRQVSDAREINHGLKAARNFADSEAAGYVDRTGLEA